MRTLMHYQKSKGHQVSGVVHWHQVGKRSEAIDDCGIEISRMSIQLIAFFVPISFLAGYSFWKKIRHSAPDILHLHMPNIACFWLLFLPSARRIPWVVHWHSDVLGEKPDWRIKFLYPFYRIFEQWLLARASKIIVTSPNYLATSQPLDKWADKCSIVPLGIDIELKGFADELNLRDIASPLKVLCIGRLTYYKGHQYLLRAISEVAKANTQIKLDIVGKGELSSDCLRLTKEFELEEMIDFHGEVDEHQLNRLLHGCDLLCLPSIERTEAFGLVLLEAMSVGKPCIVTDVRGSGMSYVVEHLKTGLVVEHSSVEALSEALVHCAAYPKHLSEWGQAGYERVQQVFSLEKVAEKVESIYLSIFPEERS